MERASRGFATLSSLVLSISCLAAQAADLVTQRVNTADVSALRQTRGTWITASNDRGEAADDLAMSHLTITLKRSPDRQAAFEDLLQQQQNPLSPNFHRWLSPSEIGQRFGASDNDVAAVSQWLQSSGLHVDSVANSRTHLDFSGSAAAVGAAFGGRVHRYVVDGDERFALATTPQIPAALSAAIDSVRGLDTVNEHPVHGAGSAMANPGATFCSGGCSHYVFPADFATIYDINGPYQQGINGVGQTIAIIGRARVYVPDIENFQTMSGLAVKDPNIIVPPAGVDPGAASSTGSSTPEDQLEATIDVTRSTSVAPGATIDLIVSGSNSSENGIAIATQYAVDNEPLPAHIISISFGACEAQAGQGGVNFYDSLFSQAAAEGISVFVISGDSGVAGCEPYLSVPSGSTAASPNYICVSSYDTCVGGTEFADTANPTAYWSSSNSSAYGSALGYIPEGAWNEPLDSNGDPQAAATGGGVSAFVPTPSWQTGVGVPGSAGRYTPDVSFSAASHDGYFACLASSGASCVPNSNGQFNFEYFYGTSASTPDMAGVAALLNQKIGSAQGNLNPRFYALAANTSNAIFHDVTVASSGVSGCSVTVPSMCNNSVPSATSLTGGTQGYLVGTGYDEATGLGSIDVGNLLAHWNDTTSSGVNLDQHGLTGSWSNPNTGGQGFEFEVFPDLFGAGEGLFTVGWFTYDTVPNGAPRWYIMSGNVSSTNPVAQLQIAADYGGNFNAPPVVTDQQVVGNATIRFSDCQNGTLSYTFTDGSGRADTIPIVRLGPSINCGATGDNGANPQNSLLSGNWYNQTTSGQGLIFDINPSINNLFATWYTYATNGATIGGASSQRWYTLQFNPFTPTQKSASNVPIVLTTGGEFDTTTSVTNTQIGSATVTFTSCDALTVTYTFTAGENKGLSGTMNLTRVGPTPAGCTF